MLTIGSLFSFVWWEEVVLRVFATWCLISNCCSYISQLLPGIIFLGCSFSVRSFLLLARIWSVSACLLVAALYKNMHLLQLVFQYAQLLSLCNGSFPYSQVLIFFTVWFGEAVYQDGRNGLHSQDGRVLYWALHLGEADECKEL